MPGTLRDRLLLAALFLSGFSSLVYQVLWLKELRLLFGATSYAAAVTLSVFFLGLTVGSRFWGRRVGRMSSPLRGYALLEGAIAATALLYFLLSSLYFWVYEPLFETFSHQRGIFLAVKLLLALALLFPPAFFMGGTIPAMGQATIRQSSNLGRRASLLYAVNTGGAALGAFFAGFYLPVTLGFRGSYLLAVGLSLLSGAIALALSPSTRSVSSAKRSQSVNAARSPAASAGAGDRAWILSLAFASGFLTLALEVIWTRMFAQVLHNSVYSFAAILVMFLLALAVGSLLAHALSASRWNPPIIAGTLLALGGAAASISAVVFYRLTDGLRYQGSRADWLEYTAGVFSDAALVMLPPAILAGALFPYLFKLSEKGTEDPGSILGRLSAVNTAGAIAGSLAAGFWMLEAFGVWRSLEWISLAYLVLGSASMLRVAGLGRALAAAPLLGILALVWAVDLSRYPVLRIRSERGDQLIEHWQGSHANVAVVSRRGNLKIKVDNYYTLGGSLSRQYEEGQTHIPVALHPKAESVFFLGMGTGITAGAALRHPVREVVVCELIPEVITAADRHFRPFINGLFEDPRVRIVAEDGRNFLQGSSQQYDVIIADLFVPWGAGTGSLYTLEHYRRVGSRLRPEGIFAQWLPLYQLSWQEFAIIARTMIEAFPQVTVWRGDFFAEKPIVALIGQNQAAPLRPDALVANAQRLSSAQPEQLRRAAVSPFLLYAGNLHEARQVLGDAPVHSDNLPLIEYLAPKSQRGQRAGRTQWLVSEPLAELFNRLMAQVPPEEDPYLKNLSPAQLGFVKAGLSFHKAAIFRQAGKNIQFEIFMRDFLSRVPFAQSPQGEQSEVYSRADGEG